MSAPKYLPRITTKNVGLNKRRLEDLAESRKDEEICVLEVFGRVTDTKEEIGEYGPYIRFMGEFEAENKVDGSIYRARQCILPPLAEMGASGKVATAREEQNKPEGSLVTAQGFAVAVTIRYNPSEKGTRFVFGSTDLMPSEVSPFAELRAQAAAISLPQPETAEEPKADAPKGKKK